MTTGIPFPRGWCTDVESLSLCAADGSSVPLQAETLDRWSDGSVRWALLDLQATCSDEVDGSYELRSDAGGVKGRPVTPLSVTVDPGSASVDTGALRVALSANGEMRVTNGDGLMSDTSGCLVVTDRKGISLGVHDGQFSLEYGGLLRAVVLFTCQLRVPGDRRRLELFVRFHFFASHPVVRLQVTLRNPHRARHDGGYWELGDAGSHLLHDFSFVIRMPAAATGVSCSTQPGEASSSYPSPFTLFQESSGGERWNSIAHVNRDEVVPMRARGYSLVAGDVEHTGRRATPVVEVAAGHSTVALAHPRFWERFPKAVTVNDQVLRLGLLPSEFPDAHELQGGEQITEEFVVSFGHESVADEPLEWVRDPLQCVISPEWYCRAQAMPNLAPAVSDPNDEYLDLVNAAVEGPDSFAAKREVIDEYGWRHFGDLYADHETVFHQSAELFVSHYNNQYDAAAGLAIHFFRSGNLTARRLFEDLARHVIDIDIYHTTEDRPAYNHGLFWHTAHHVNAGRATHRTYPKGSAATGGPAAEHNYNTGLMLYHFLTGDRRAREAAIDLAQWVIDMDDGNLTPMRWLSRAPTGFASATGSFDYHGPGRGPGNGIVALLNAFRLTGEHRFMDKAEGLIRRCVHPGQDLNALKLLDTERRWYYTVFLQALGRYLDVKAERDELDEHYAYAQATLLHYARWMADHEYPYLDKPEILEFPNETWAAQDMRKSEVFEYAAKHASERERSRFRERAERFFDYSVRTLTGMPGHRFTRPTVLMLTNGYSQAYFRAHSDVQAPQGPAPVVVSSLGRFTPQRQVALRRLGMAAGVGSAVLMALLLLLLR